MEFIEDLVSVIIPVFNAGRFLDRTIQSVLGQTYRQIEIILVDDCSKDNSAEIIKTYMHDHSQILYFLQKKNMGAGVARNKALELAKGQYVAFLDSDDIWQPEKIGCQVKLMKEKEIPFCYTAIEMIDENGKIVKSKRNLKEQCDYSYLLCNTIIATSSVVVDRRVLGDFRMSLRRGGQDYATWLMLLRSGIIACGVNEAMVQYRVVSGSLSSNKLKSIKQVWEIQTQDEQIGKIVAAFHVCCFLFNALKKYLI